MPDERRFEPLATMQATLTRMADNAVATQRLITGILRFLCLPVAIGAFAVTAFFVLG